MIALEEDVNILSGFWPKLFWGWGYHLLSKRGEEGQLI